MPDIQLWGADGSLGLAFAQRPVWAIVLWLLLGAVIAATLAALHGQARPGPRRRAWLGTVGLALAALLLSQIVVIPVTTPNQLAPLDAARNPEAYAAVFGAAPVLLAAVLLNPTGALIVGLAGGLGRALWQTHSWFTPLHWALVALVASWLTGQNFAGRFWAWLRRPWIAGPLSVLPLVPLIAFSAFVDTPPAAGALASFDFALSTARAHLLTLALEAVLAGIVVALVLRGFGELLPPRPAPVASPFDRSLRWQLLGSYAAFSLGLTFVLVILVYTQSVNSTLDLVVGQMAGGARGVSDYIPEILGERQNQLREAARADELLRQGEQRQIEALARLYRSAAYYRRILLVDSTSVVRAAYPPASSDLALTGLEQTAVAEALRSNSPLISDAYRSTEDGFGVSFVTPVGADPTAPEAVLVGRAPEVALREAVAGLQNTLGEGRAFLVDSLGQIIAHPDPSYLLQPWSPPSGNPKALATDVPGAMAYEGRAGTSNARQIVVYVPGEAHPWTVVLEVPYSVVLRLALRVGAPTTVVLLVSILGFAGLLVIASRRVTQPLRDLVRLTQEIAAGNLAAPLDVERQDEIGQLGKSFGTMQRSLQKRLDELSLLLSVSQDVSASIDIHGGMPAILQGALRGSGAAGVRVVVRNPNSSEPLLFPEGPAAGAMAAFDRQLMTLARTDGEQMLSSPRAIAERLRTEESSLPVRAIVALPLRHSGQFLGVLWLGYRGPHQPDATELGLLRTLAGQAAILVVNGHLYANAEGGRRRLAAVLASTSDAVIVTDQGDRVLYINPAMERAFGLVATRVQNQPVATVLGDPALVEAVSGPIDRARGREIAVEDGRVWYANPSNIVSREGHVLGRVVVLHDITSLKELDRLKSEFMDTITHDLRSPLGNVLQYAMLMSTAGELNDEQRMYIDGIKTSVNQLTVLVDELLELSKLESGAVLEREPVSIPGLLQDLSVSMALPATQAGLRLVLDIEGDIPLTTGDARYLHKALENLVGNAIKYAPQTGELTLGARLSATGEEIILSVRDRGPGISREDQMRIFEKFYRVKDKSRRAPKGSGVGLAIVRSVVERHGGRVWCESELGQGTTFYIALPIVPPDAELFAD